MHAHIVNMYIEAIWSIYGIEYKTYTRRKEQSSNMVTSLHKYGQDFLNIKYFMRSKKQDFKRKYVFPSWGKSWLRTLGQDVEGQISHVRLRVFGQALSWSEIIIFFLSFYFSFFSYSRPFFISSNFFEPFVSFLLKSIIVDFTFLKSFYSFSILLNFDIILVFILSILSFYCLKILPLFLSVMS